MEKQSRVLRKFIKNANNISNIVLLNYNQNIWNKYKNYFTIDDSKIYSLYQSIEDILKYKKSEIYNKYFSHMYSCEYINENNISNEEIFEMITNLTNFYIENYQNDEYLKDIQFFLNWLFDLSKCVNISMFKEKVYELVNKVYYYKSYSYFKLYNKIEFKENTQSKKILIGDFLNKKIRNCSLLKKYECNDECYWEGGFLNLFKPNRCKNKDIKELITNTYCSDLSYKTREELITILKLFTSVETISYDDFYKLKLAYSNKIILDNKKIDLSILTDKELCELFRSILNDSIIESISEKDTQLDYLKKLGFNRYTAGVFIYNIYDSISFSYTFYEIIKRCYRLLALIYDKIIKDNKKLIGLILLICFIFYQYPYMLSGKPVFNYNTPLEYIYQKYQLLKQLPNKQDFTVDPVIFGELKEFENSSGVSPEHIAMIFGNHIDKSVLEKAKEVYYGNNNLYNITTDSINEEITVFPILLDFSKSELKYPLPTNLPHNVLDNIITEQSKIAKIFNKLKINNENYNPFYTFIKTNGYEIKHESVKVNDIFSFFDFKLEIKNDKNFDIYKDYYNTSTINGIINSIMNIGANIAKLFMRGDYDHLTSISLNVAVNPITGEKVLLNQYDVYYALKQLNITDVTINAIYMHKNESYNDFFNKMNGYLHNYVYTPPENI